MKVWLVPAGMDASADLRMVWPGLMAAQAGHDVHVCSVDWTLDAFMDRNGTVVDVATPNCDVLVFQRLQSRPMVESIPLLQAKGIAVVVDTDDAFSLVDPANSAYGHVHPQVNPDMNWSWLDKACRMADLVTATTPALAALYGRHGRVAVVPNRLPRQVLSIEHTDAERLRIGWAGNVAVHPRDLAVTRGAVARCVRELGVTYVNIGPGGTWRDLGLERECVTGFVAPREWYSTIAAEADIAVVPLADTRFNEAKSSLALLTHASVGLPAVASPTPDNCRLNVMGMGVMARIGREWHQGLRRLITDDGWRADVAARSKAAAATQSLEDHLTEWTDAWSLAREHHQWRSG